MVHLKISCESKENSVRTLKFSFLDWSVDINNGEALNLISKKVLINKLKPQSKLTCNFVESIINNNKCDLPSIEESILLHKVFIESNFQNGVITLIKND